jgi:uncharacterized cupin superfamily protein
MAKKPKKDSPYILRREDIAARETGPIIHPWNERSGLFGVRLGDAVGLARTGVAIARLPPGKESFCYHAHRGEEEWLYILAGEAVAHIDGKDYPVFTGDFLAFPTAPPVAHLLRNPGPEDVVYLMGGERREMDIVDFPLQAKVMMRQQDRVETVDAKRLEPLKADAPKKKRKKG